MHDLSNMIFATGCQAVPCLMFGGFVALIIVGIVWGIIRNRKRREEMNRLAAELGFRYYPDDPWGLPTRYAGMDVFQQGHSRKASNILAGEMQGRSVLLFDYQYTTGSGKDETTTYYLVGLFEMPILAPRLWLRRESIFDAVASWFGHDDIGFESTEFSRRYHVKCEERKFAYDIFHARLIEYLLASGDTPAMEMNGPLMVLYQGLKGIDQIRRLLTIGTEIIHGTPDYVLHERGVPATRGG